MGKKTPQGGHRLPVGARPRDEGRMKKLTAQQYSECWRERLNKEQQAFTEALVHEQLREQADKKAAEPVPPARTQQDDDVKSTISLRSTGSALTGISQISSRVSTSSATARKVEILQQQLESERRKRHELEMVLKKASAPSPVATPAAPAV